MIAGAAKTTTALRAASRVEYPDLPEYLRGQPYSNSQFALEFRKAAKLVYVCYACIDRLASYIAAQPVVFYRRQRNGKPVRIEPERGNCAFVWEAGNPTLTAYQIEVERQANLDASGNAFLFLDRHGLKSVAQLALHPLPAHLVEIVPGDHRTIAGYIWRGNGAMAAIRAEDVIHFRRWTLENELIGYSPLEAVRIQYETLYGASRWGDAFYKKGGQVSGIFSTMEGARALGPNGVKKAKKELGRLFQGVENAFDPVILEGLEYKRAGLTHREMAFLETTGWSEAAVCMIYGLAPVVMGIKEGGGLSDAGASTDMLLTIEGGLMPRWKLRDGILTKSFCKLWGEDIYAETDLSGLHALAAQKLDLAKGLMELTGKRAILSPDEARVESGREPSGQEGADQLEAPTPIDPNVVPGAPGEKPKAKPKPKAKSAAASRASRLDDAMEEAFATLNRIGNTLEPQARDAVDDSIDDEQGVEKLSTKLRKLIAARGEEALAEIGVEIVLDDTSEKYANWTRAHAAKAIRNVNATTRKKIREEIAKAQEQKASFEKVIGILDDIFEGRRENVLTIARTETLGAYNFATLEAWIQSGEVEAKLWVHVHDDEVRDAHVQAAEDGDIPLTALWTMTGEDGKSGSCRFPGEETLPGSLRINCRCGMTAILRGERAFSPARAVEQRVSAAKRHSALLARYERAVARFFAGLFRDQRDTLKRLLEQEWIRSEHNAEAAIRVIAELVESE